MSGKVKRSGKEEKKNPQSLFFNQSLIKYKFYDKISKKVIEHSFIGTSI